MTKVIIKIQHGTKFFDIFTGKKKIIYLTPHIRVLIKKNIINI